MANAIQFELLIYAYYFNIYVNINVFILIQDFLQLLYNFFQKQNF